MRTEGGLKDGDDWIVSRKLLDCRWEDGRWRIEAPHPYYKNCLGESCRAVYVIMLPRKRKKSFAFAVATFGAWRLDKGGS